jgi:hypothetical protein
VLADLLKLIHDTPNLDWLLLSKRPKQVDKVQPIPEDLMIREFPQA